MAFFSSAITTLKTLVVAIGAGLGVWGVVNLLEGYGNDNPGAKSQGIKQLMAYWGLENEAYMAFGDSMNDCEMLQEAAVGVAMGNAMDAVKAYADHICGSSDTTAIHDTLQAYGLIH